MIWHVRRGFDDSIHFISQSCLFFELGFFCCSSSNYVIFVWGNGRNISTKKNANANIRQINTRKSTRTKKKRTKMRKETIKKRELCTVHCVELLIFVGVFLCLYECVFAVCVVGSCDFQAKMRSSATLNIHSTHKICTILDCCFLFELRPTVRSDSISLHSRCSRSISMLHSANDTLCHFFSFFLSPFSVQLSYSQPAMFCRFSNSFQRLLIIYVRRTKIIQ